MVEQYNLSFHEYDTLKSLKEQWLKVRKRHHQVRGKYDKLNGKSQLAIYDAARTEGGVMSNLVFDDALSTWTANMLIETSKENSVVRRSKHTIHHSILIK